jgi:hypothetical protein
MFFLKNTHITATSMISAHYPLHDCNYSRDTSGPIEKPIFLASTFRLKSFSNIKLPFSVRYNKIKPVCNGGRHRDGVRPPHFESNSFETSRGSGSREDYNM